MDNNNFDISLLETVMNQAKVGQTFNVPYAIKLKQQQQQVGLFAFSKQ